MLPTYGPSWIYFYGAQRNYKILPGDENLNEGIGEGTAYRGRLLISINTTFEPGNVTGPSAVYRDKLQAGRVGTCNWTHFYLSPGIYINSLASYLIALYLMVLSYSITVISEIF